jgi:hypothetical protein
MQEIITHFFYGLGQETIAGIGAAVGATIIYVLNKLYLFWKQRKSKRSPSVARLNEIDINVYKVLAEAMVYTSADRVYVIQFHNGTYFLNNTDLLKMSCTHEITKTGISREQEKFQDLVVSKFPKVINELITHPIIGLSIKSFDGYYFSELMKNRGAKTCILTAIKGAGMIEGYLGIDYLEEIENIEDVVQKYRNFVLSISAKIGSTLREKN